MFDSSVCTDQENVKRYGVPSKIFFLWENKVFVGSRPEMVPQIKYFRKLSTSFKKLDLK